MSISSSLQKPTMRAFLDEFTTPRQHQNHAKVCQVVTDPLQETLMQISSDALAAHGVDIYPHLYVAWTTWLLNWQTGADAVKGDAELVVGTLTMIRGQWLRLEEVLSHPQYLQMSSVTNDLCHLLSYKDCNLSKEIELKMQKLVQLVLCDTPGDLDPDFKQTFLTVAKAFYYRSYFDTETVNHHIRKVLFENVICR